MTLVAWQHRAHRAAVLLHVTAGGGDEGQIAPYRPRRAAIVVGTFHLPIDLREAQEHAIARWQAGAAEWRAQLAASANR